LVPLAAEQQGVRRLGENMKEDKLRQAVDALLALIEGHADSFESPPDQAPRQFAAAGLMRRCALLRGVCVLEDARLGPVPGILERQHWETWLVSIHVVLRGFEALYEVAGDDIFWKTPALR
jgi:hypothetical protein